MQGHCRGEGGMREVAVGGGLWKEVAGVLIHRLFSLTNGFDN